MIQELAAHLIFDDDDGWEVVEHSNDTSRTKLSAKCPVCGEVTDFSSVLAIVLGGMWCTTCENMKSNRSFSAIPTFIILVCAAVVAKLLRVKYRVSRRLSG